MRIDLVPKLLDALPCRLELGVLLDLLRLFSGEHLCQALTVLIVLHELGERCGVVDARFFSGRKLRDLKRWNLLEILTGFSLEIIERDSAAGVHVNDAGSLAVD